MGEEVIIEPGIHEVSDEEYHAGKNTPDESLSVTWAKKLLPPSCPAKYRHERDHGQPPRDAFDFGRAAHALLLERTAIVAMDDWYDDPSVIVSIDAPDWRLKAARELRDEVRKVGATPLLASDAAKVIAMADALHGSELIESLLASAATEQAMYGIDPATGVWLRGKADIIRNGEQILDYKTTAASAHPEKFARTVADYGYHMQAAWYIDLWQSITGEAVPFGFVVQEKEAPYLSSVAYLDDDYIELGRKKNRQAIDTFAACLESGVWPGYTDDEPAIITPPGWMTRAAEAESAKQDAGELLSFLEGIM